MLLPAGSMPPVAVWVVEALAKSQRVTDKLLRLTLVCHLLLLRLALQLQQNNTAVTSSFMSPPKMGEISSFRAEQRKREESDLLNIECCHGDDVIDVRAGANLLHVGQVPFRNTEVDEEKAY